MGSVCLNKNSAWVNASLSQGTPGRKRRTAAPSTWVFSVEESPKSSDNRTVSVSETTHSSCRTVSNGSEISEISATNENETNSCKDNDVMTVQSCNSDLQSDREYSVHSYKSSSAIESSSSSSPKPSEKAPIITEIFVSSTCSRVLLAKEFVNSINWPKALFDESQDRCYCPNCYLSNWEDVLLTANSYYVIPRGWVRLGLRVDPIYAEEHDIWNKWIVTFHGTTKTAARSILIHRHFYLPGDRLIDGSILGIREGHIPDQRFIFTSPTIAYSSSTAYAPNHDFYSNAHNTLYEVQIVLQCRQKPNSFKIQGETIRAGSIRICPFIPNEKIEYYTDIRSSIVAYGLLLRFREKTEYLHL